jgi:hypothetical protein
MVPSLIPKADHASVCCNLPFFRKGWHVQCSADLSAPQDATGIGPAPLWRRKGTEHCAVNG